MQPLECEPSGAELLRPTPAAKTSARSYSLKGPLAAVVLVAAVVSLIVVVVTSDGSPTAENLLEAVQSRDVPLVERLLAKGAPVNELVRDAHYRRITALYAAVFDRNIEMATVLVKHGADVFRSTQYGKGPSKIAFDADMQALLAAQGKKQAAFVAAVVACPRTTCKIQELLTGGADAGWTEEDAHRTGLMAAAMLGNDDLVRMLLSNNAPVDAVDTTGHPALMFAAHSAVESGCLKQLLAAHADVDIQDDNGMTTLMHAASEGRASAVAQLVAANADATRHCYKGTTALMYAARENCLACVKTLLTTAVDVEETDHKGKTAADMTDDDAILKLLKASSNA